MHGKVEWRYSCLVNGALFVMMGEMMLMHMLSAVNLDTIYMVRKVILYLYRDHASHVLIYTQLCTFVSCYSMSESHKAAISIHAYAKYCWFTRVLYLHTYQIYIQVNETSCRLRTATYRDGVKRKRDQIGMGYIVCMCIIMRRSEIFLSN